MKILQRFLPSVEPAGEEQPDDEDGNDRGVEWTLPNGGEVEISGRDDIYPADRIEFTRTGHVKLFDTQHYDLSVYPSERVEAIHTYTKHVEGEEWF